MRSHPTFPVTVLVVALLLLPGPSMLLASGSPGPFDSSPTHEAGYWNTTFTDSATNDLDLTVYYPAQAAGEDALKDVSGAPYPMLLIVHQPGISPAFKYWRSYGEHLSQRGYVVGIMDTDPYQSDVGDDYDDMVTATHDALDLIADEHDTPGTQLYGMVNTSAVVVAGHGQGAWVALYAALNDTSDRIHAVASIDLDHRPTTGQPAWSDVGRLDLPLLLLEGSTGNAGHSHDAFEAKAKGYAALMNIRGANFTQFMDNTTVVWSEPQATINHTQQLVLAKRYIMAFLDFHLKGDVLASIKLYGSQAAADLDDGTLAEWRYGVLDQSVSVTQPAPDEVVPAGPLDIYARIVNVGPFPMTARNVTLEVVRVLPGPVYQNVFGPENRTVPAQPDDTFTDVVWKPTLTVYGDYAAFVRMDDPDHNTSNDRAQQTFSVVPLQQPTIEHDPPASMELGEAYNLTCRLEAPSGIMEAFVNFSDEEGYRQELPLTLDPASGNFYVELPAPKGTGQVIYKIHAKAVNGATNITNPYYIPVLDTTPPLIVHTPQWTELPVLAQVEFNATVTDVGGIDEVRLLFTEPATGFHNVTCGRDGDRWFYPVVLGAVQGTMEYSWYAVDNWGNAASTATFSIDIVDDGPPVLEPVPPSPVELGDDVVLEARVYDGSALEGVWVLFTRPGDTAVTNATPESVGNLYRLTIGDLTSAGNLSYSWWVRDVNGNTATTGDLEVAVVDTRPPEITDIVTGDAIVGARPWVQATIVDMGGLKSVVMDYVDVQGSQGSVAMEEILPDIYQAFLPVQSIGGALTYSIMATDPSDNVEHTGPRTLVIRDTEPPVIIHVPPQDLVEGEALTFEVEVTDNVGVAEVWLYLRLTASASIRRLVMENVEADLYSYTLPEGELRQPYVIYYFEAEDMPPSSNVATDPDGAPQVTYLLNVTAREMRIFGTVKASGGDPIEGASANLVGHDDTVDTDEEGSYEFTGLVAGSYIIEVSAEGFETFSTTVIISVEQGDRKLDVTMVPRKTTDVDDEGLPWTMLAAVVIFAIIAVLVIIMLRSGSPER